MGSTPKNISGSRVAAILGKSPFMTPVAVWLEIEEELFPGFCASRGYELPERSENSAIRFGLLFENAIATITERITGKRITDREKFFERDFMTCHVDGIFEDGVLYEAKTTTSFVYRELWGAPGTDHMPIYYQCQAQHNLMLSRSSRLELSLLVFPESPDAFENLGWIADIERNLLARNGVEINPLSWTQTLSDMGYLKLYYAEPNPEAQRLMVEAYREFWYNHILTGTPPEPRNYEDVKRLFPEPKSTIIVPDYIERKIAEYKGITEETANAKKRKERLRMIVTKYAATHVGIEDDESKEAVIFRNEGGEKLGSWSRTKNGTLVFRC